MRIDSHHHLWQYSSSEYPWISQQMSVLRRDFTADDLKAETSAAGIEGVVSVQARQSIAETEWLLGIAAQNKLIQGIVGWLPLAAVNVQEQIERLTHDPLLKSVRHVVQDEPDDAFILGKEFNRGVALLKNYGLVYDILIFARHLPAAIEFVDQHPEQSFVLDHIAKPTIRAAEFDQTWEDNFRQIAKRENVTCKFSALVTEVRDPSWNAELLRPYWNVAVEAFTPQRLMFGSDWPVCLLRSSYARWIETVAEFASQLSQTEQADFWGRTAQRAYDIDAR